MDVNDPSELKPFDLSDARNLRALEGFKIKILMQALAQSTNVGALRGKASGGGARI